MSHDYQLEPGVRPGADLPQNVTLRRLAKSLNWLNRQMLRLSMLALVLTSVVLTYSVLTRYLFKVATDWQDEASVFMLVGAIFICTAYVQSQRGHVGIEALAAILSPRINRLRQILVDVTSTVFCGFFCWKSWTLFYEAWSEGQTTSSSFAPPLWIPYSLMALGMTLLTLQLLLQSAIEVVGEEARKKQA